MAQTAINVCRRALLRVGDTDTVNSIESPQTEGEKYCAEFYDQARRETLRKHVWNFAKRRIEISKEVSGPLFGFSARYKLPTDFVRIVQVGSDIRKTLYYDYAVEGGYLLADGIAQDDGELYLVYIRDEIDLNKWDAAALELLVLYLAEKLAFPLTKKQSLVTAIQEEIRSKAVEAKGVDGQDQPPKRVERSRMVETRRSGLRRNNQYEGYYF